jgi:hypothetical protein
MVVAAGLVVAGCSGDGTTQPTGDTAGDGQASSSEGGTATSGGDGGDGSGTGTAPSLPLLESGQAVAADLEGPSAELVTLQESPFIGAAVYPRPDYEGNPWSQWGQGIALADGRVISAIGDHLGADGNSYLYVYDPGGRTITRFADVLSALDHEPGSWGYGKIHSQMVDPGDGTVYFTTYYGSRTDLAFDASYQGDVLFRLDQADLELEPIAVPVPQHGVPSLATNGAGLVYGEAVDPLLDDAVYPEGGFFVFDTTSGTVELLEEDPQHELFRNVMVGLDGTAWYAGQGGSLFRYDPEANEISPSGVELSGPLRASTRPAGDGTIYGVTEEPYDFFAFGPGGEVRPLGSALEYATSLALLPDESGFLYVPGAHGDAHLAGAPLISVDAATGEQTTVAELEQLARDELGLVLGGTYSITVDTERGQAHIGFNAGETEDEPWGEVVFVVVELP